MFQYDEINVPELITLQAYPQINFVQDFYTLHINSKELITWYQQNTQSQFVILPISKISSNVPYPSLKLLFESKPQQNQSLLVTLNKNLTEVGQRQLGVKILELCNIGCFGQINLTNLFLQGNHLKAHLTETVKSQEVFCKQFVDLLQKIWSKDQVLGASLEQLGKLEIKNLLKTKQRLKVKPSIAHQLYTAAQNLRSLQFKTKKTQFSSEQLKWVMQVLELPCREVKPIYLGTQKRFSPDSLHSAIGGKSPLFYLLESEFGHRVCFYCPLMFKQSKWQMFGSYLVDPQLRSRILNLNQRTVHSLAGNPNIGNNVNKAVGYGKQCLLVIGQYDFLLTAGNITNLCKFPVSYQPDYSDVINNPIKMIGGQVFQLKELIVYQLGKQILSTKVLP